MVRVANCPKCNHEAVIFDETDSDDWARCPECRTYFQIKSVAAREIPAIVMSKDEALLADEESAASVETVCSALETRWDDSRRTLSAASSKTLAEIESQMTSAQQNDDDDEPHDDDAQDPADYRPTDRAPDKPDAPKHLTGTVADFSMLGTWSDLPRDEIEAQARAEEAGDAPMDPINPTTGDAHLADEAAAEAINLDREFQFKETLADFAPVALDNAGAPADFNENVLDEIDDDSLPDEDASDWDDAEKMVRLLTSRDNAGNDVEEVDEEPIDRKRSGDSTVVAATVTPDILPRRTQAHWAQNRRQRSALRSIAMIAIAGVVGSALGYYALFWIAGPNADFLRIAQYLPSGLLPAEFGTAVSPATRSESQTPESNAPAEVQASHTEPVVDDDTLTPADDVQQAAHAPDSSLTTAAGTANELAASEPLELDPPAADPLADESVASETPIVNGVPTFTIEELSAALQMARESQPGLVNGDLDGSIEEKRAKGKSYAILCDLAQKAVFIEPQSQAGSVAALDKEVQDLFRTTLANPQTREEVARIVPMWLASANRKHGGIFFAAALQSQSEQGSFVECEVDIDGQMFTVIVPKAQSASLPQSAEPVAIVGWFVDRPSDSVIGYSGQATHAIWAGHIIPIE